MDQLSPASSAPGTTSRRNFLRRTGVGFGVAASALAIQACDSGNDGDGEVPNEGVLQGYVRDPDGEFVEGATITAGTQTATTDANGFYQFEELPTGTYTVTAAPPAGPATAGSFDTETAEVNIVRGGTGYVQNFTFGTDLAVVTFDFSSDIGVLNYAYALEQLEAAFYATVVSADGFSSAFSADEQGVLQDLAAHEAIHRDFLAAALGDSAIPGLLPNFGSIDFDSRASVLSTALVFEDLGVAAYNGAGQYLTSDDFLTLAGKIVSVEARHASVIAGLITANAVAGSGIIDENGLDRALAPSAVLAAADPFIFNTVSASNVPA